MYFAAGNLKDEDWLCIKNCFFQRKLSIEKYLEGAELRGSVISFDKFSSRELSVKNIDFINWDLLFSNLGPNDRSSILEDRLMMRIDILAELNSIISPIEANELHGSIRVHNLAQSSKFYSWLFGIGPKEWTHRYVIFTRKDIRFNFVLLVSDGKTLNHDTLYHLGMGVDSKEKVIGFYHSAQLNGFEIHNPPRTTWRGTPLHELWLKDPDGTLIEIYARLTDEELKEMPEDMEPIFLVK